MNTNGPFSSPGIAGTAATLSWDSSPYSGHGLTRIGRALSLGSGASRIRVRLFRSPTHDLVVRVIGRCQATLKPHSQVSGEMTDLIGARVSVESDADGCVVTITDLTHGDRWERETLRWSDGTVHSVASPAIRTAESAGRNLRLEAAARPRSRRWLFGS